MSRIGKQPVPLPQGVRVHAADGVVRVEGPNGTLERRIQHLAQHPFTREPAAQLAAEPHPRLGLRWLGEVHLGLEQHQAPHPRLRVGGEERHHRAPTQSPQHQA